MRKSILASLVLALCMPAGADWIVRKYSFREEPPEVEPYWVSGCIADRGVYGSRYFPLANVSVQVDLATIWSRHIRGDADIYKPALVIRGRADLGGAAASRPAPHSLGISGYQTVDPYYVVLYGVFNYQDPKEYRFRYEIDGGERVFAWGQQFTVTLENLDGDRVGESAAVLWMDPPDELFEDDEERNLKLYFAGLSTARLDDRAKSLAHAMRMHIAFDYGSDVLADIDQCVKDHRNAGRWDSVPEESQARAAFPHMLMR